MSQADFDKVVTQELYYHKQDHDDPDNEAYLALLLTLAGLIDQGKTVKQLKRVIKSSPIGTSAYLPFIDAIDSQGKHIVAAFRLVSKNVLIELRMRLVSSRIKLAVDIPCFFSCIILTIIAAAHFDPVEEESRLDAQPEPINPV
jgi:hypothetical protein